MISYKGHTISNALFLRTLFIDYHEKKACVKEKEEETQIIVRMRESHRETERESYRETEKPKRIKEKQRKTEGDIGI